MSGPSPVSAAPRVNFLVFNEEKWEICFNNKFKNQKNSLLNCIKLTSHYDDKIIEILQKLLNSSEKYLKNIKIIDLAIKRLERPESEEQVQRSKCIQECEMQIQSLELRINNLAVILVQQFQENTPLPYQNLYAAKLQSVLAFENASLPLSMISSSSSSSSSCSPPKKTNSSSLFSTSPFSSSKPEEKFECEEKAEFSHHHAPRISFEADDGSPSLQQIIIEHDENLETQLNNQAVHYLNDLDAMTSTFMKSAAVNFKDEETACAFSNIFRMIFTEEMHSFLNHSCRKTMFLKHSQLESGLSASNSNNPHLPNPLPIMEQLVVGSLIGTFFWLFGPGLHEENAWYGIGETLDNHFIFIRKAVILNAIPTLYKRPMKIALEHYHDIVFPYYADFKHALTLYNLTKWKEEGNDLIVSILLTRCYPLSPEFIPIITEYQQQLLLTRDFPGLFDSARELSKLKNRISKNQNFIDQLPQFKTYSKNKTIYKNIENQLLAKHALFFTTDEIFAILEPFLMREPVSKEIYPEFIRVVMQNLDKEGFCLSARNFLRLLLRPYKPCYISSEEYNLHITGNAVAQKNEGVNYKFDFFNDVIDACIEMQPHQVAKTIYHLIPINLNRGDLSKIHDRLTKKGYVEEAEKVRALDAASKRHGKENFVRDYSNEAAMFGD